jgi:hypothetical protein
MIGFWAAFVQANPFVCDDAANTCTYRITATEPTKTASGALLNSQPGNAYKQTNIKTSLNGGAFGIIVKPATAPAGGGQVVQDVTFATTPCAVTTLAVKLSGTNVSNKEGVETAAVGSPVTRDRTADPICVEAPGVVTGTVN